MNIDLERLRRKAIELIKNPLVQDVSVLARLAPIPAKIQHLETQLQQIENEKSRIEKLLEEFSERPQSSNVAPPPSVSNTFSSLRNGRREQKKLRIEIDLPKLGLPGDKMIISEHKASDSLISFLVFLYEKKGAAVLEKLSKFSVNRGAFVSRDPSTDYRYMSGGGEAEYQYQRISNSGYFALTQSATKEKVSDIRNAWQFLNFPGSALKVDEIEKY